MRFILIDRISDFEPGVRITAIKELAPGEEYLQDHFPRFPVMPGVLMLEAMYQASALLVYKTDDFRRSTVLLKEARNVKYADFVQPGQTLVVRSELVKLDGALATLKATGCVGEGTAVSGKLLLECFNIVDRYPQRAAWDDYSRNQMRRLFTSLHRPPPNS